VEIAQADAVMDLTVLGSHLLLIIALVALGDASLRLSSLISPSGLERVVSCAVLAAAVAVLEALVLGRVALGGSRFALAGGMALLWMAARAWLPAPTTPPARELRHWWERLELPARAGIGALVGGVLAVAITILHRPAPGFDGVTYHLPEAVGFVQSGHTGSVLNLYYGLPVGNYPMTNEVLLSWLAGISHGFAALTLWSPASYLLLFMAGWLGLRALRVPGPSRALALCALLLTPLVIAGLPQPDTDLPATTWLVCSAALSVSARERPLLLVPAIVALGMSIGTKTTGALLGILVLAFALWSLRAHLRPIAWPLALGAIAAAGVGATWYLRNFIEHGSPLWPFVATPWGDRVPLTVQLVSHTLAERFRVTLLDHLGTYLSTLSGATLLAAVAVGTLAWVNAPVTGLSDIPGLYWAVLSSVRYLLPVFAAGACALALAATEGTRGPRSAALIALTGALAWSLVSDINHGFFLPFASWLATGVLAGTALAATSRYIRAAPRGAAAAASLVLILACGAGLAVGSTGFLARHAKVVAEWDAAAAGFLLRQPDYDHGRVTVAAAPDALGPLAGDRLQHRISLIGQTDSCEQVRALSRRSWVVLRVASAQPVPGRPGVLFPYVGTAQACLANQPPLFDDGAYRIYGPRS
jgi:hypothetical protein